MNILFKFLFIIFISLLISQITKAEQLLKYANMDQLIKETKIGNKMIKKINEIDQENIKKLSSYEKELKNIENEIKLKKNIISEKEFEKEINDLKKKIANFNKEKNIMAKNFNNIKKKELKILFDKINPVVQNYMNENSIDIIFNSKNIYIGNKKSDLTKLLIEEINNNINE
tara:strand:+ start:791 stop:1306 length:516 start_codon:yes stop_codon:yes gene_type:complete